MPINEVSVAELETALANGVRLVDVRETAEYLAGHVPGAVHVPLASVPEHLAAFEGPGATYIICKVGGRSMKACEYLAHHGIEAVNVAGGTLDWLAGNRPMVAGGTPL